MDNVKNDAYYIKRLKQDLEFVVTHMKNVDIEELNANEVLLDSMLFRMIQISENAKKLSDEYKLHRGNVPWNAIYGLRNRIVHDYGNVDRKDIDEVENISSIVGAMVEQRTSLGLSQRELAAMCGIPQSSVARIESCKTTPNLGTLLNIFQHLGLQLTVR